MRLGKLSNRKRVVHELQHRVRVRVHDVCLQPAVLSLVVESESQDVSLRLNNTSGYVPKVEILHAKFRVLDLNLAVHLRDRIGLILVARDVGICLQRCCYFMQSLRVEGSLRCLYSCHS